MHTDPLADTTVVLPPGVTIDRYTVTGQPSGNRLEATPRVHIEPYRDEFHAGPRDDAWMIRKGFPSDRLLWNYTLGDWSYPHVPDPDDFTRPLDKAISQARRIVGLDSDADPSPQQRSTP
ncbi:hypothetical protein [Nonomuraea aridisoli]|uniref:Uncharacterized protein n=1 Tax=Nonomuraea aridisoli TaxID=2070368 RepID=A0A2W2EHW8_9ACTN|nr:hypothetical protein [Nonomuraea aridisoli]PZG08917.1 hypothetical protein C1J01_38390 [Nonomuraea aridisoli]